MNLFVLSGFGLNRRKWNVSSRSVKFSPFARCDAVITNVVSFRIRPERMAVVVYVFDGGYYRSKAIRSPST